MTTAVCSFEEGYQGGAVKRQMSFVQIVFTGYLTVAGVCAQARSSMDTQPVSSFPGFFGPVSARLRAGEVAPDLVSTRLLQPAGAAS